jgi:cytoskeletal protein CcmA (bactofilin family)
MFSKSRINDPGPKKVQDEEPASYMPESGPSRSPMEASAPPKAKPPASTLSADLTVTGNLKTSGDIMVEGTVDGDIRAHLLTVGEGATIRGEIVADDVVINGRIVGRVRGLKVRLSSSARVEGDIIHKTIAIESGAHFEGSVQRQDDPLSTAARGGDGKAAGQQQPAAQQRPASQQPAQSAGGGKTPQQPAPAGAPDKS